MKLLKISIVLITVGAIVFFVVQSLDTTKDEVEQIPLPENVKTKEIEFYIDSLGKLPDSKFCEDFYNYVSYLIEDSYKAHPPQYPYGRLGNTQAENDQRKNDYTRELYSVYAEKFIHQAFYMFCGSEWKDEDLIFIRNEYQKLHKSDLLEKGSPIDKRFIEIQNIFDKYDEINFFISDCKRFDFSKTMLSESFPIPIVEAKINRTKMYQNNGLENRYVNNCTYLQNELKEIPQMLFKVHVGYLDNKINHWSKYSNYSIINSRHNERLYEPLSREIRALSLTYTNSNITNLNNEYNRLFKKLNDAWKVISENL